MANNVFANKPGYYVPQIDATFESLGYNVGNTLIIREKWDGATASWKPDRAINGLLGYTAGRGIAMHSLTNRDEEVTLIGGGYIPGGGGGEDTTAPTVVSATAATPTTIVVVFSEVVTATNVGWSFKRNGVANNPTGIAGSGTTTLTFTVPFMLTGETILRSYDSGAGNTMDAASNELVTFTDQAVTNSVTTIWTQIDGGSPGIAVSNGDKNLDHVGTLDAVAKYAIAPFTHVALSGIGDHWIFIDMGPDDLEDGLSRFFALTKSVTIPGTIAFGAEWNDINLFAAGGGTTGDSGRPYDTGDWYKFEWAANDRIEFSRSTNAGVDWTLLFTSFTYESITTALDGPYYPWVMLREGGWHDITFNV